MVRVVYAIDVMASPRRSRAAADAAARKDLMLELLRLMLTDDAREGLMSFVERRAAVFTGR